MADNYLMNKVYNQNSYGVSNYLPNVKLQDINDYEQFIGERYYSFSQKEDNPTVLSQAIDYTLLPLECDVFSNIKKEIIALFSKEQTEQASFFKYFYELFNESLKKEFYQKKMNIALPKFSFSEDNDGAYVLNLNKSTFRLFINFEKKKNDSFYGFISQDEVDSYTTKNGKISETNCSQIINSIIGLLSKN